MGTKLKVFLAAILLFLPLPILAISAKSGDIIILGKDEVIDGNYYAAGNKIEIYGTVNGDLFLAGSSIKVDSANINGDIFAAGNSLKIKGKTNGSLRLIGQYLEIDGEIAKRVMALGQSLDVSQDALVKEHLNFYGQTLGVAGKVEGRLEGAMESFHLSGEVSKDVELYLDNSKNQSIQLFDSAKIGGGLYYNSIKEGVVSGADKAMGGVHFNKIVQKEKKDFNSAKAFGALMNFFGLLIVGMIFIYIWPKLFSRTAELAYKKPISTFFKGLALLVLTPVLFILLLMTFIGIPLAFIVIVLWGIALYVAQIFGAWILGKLIKDKLFKKYHWSKLWIFVAGVLVYTLLGRIPFVGWIIVMILYLMAWGVFMDLVANLKVKKQ